MGEGRDRALEKFDDGDGASPSGQEVVENPNPDDELEPLAGQLASLTLSLLNATSVHEVLTEVVRVVDGIIPEADVTGITLRSPDGHLHTPIETSELAHELDQLQYELGEGPCWEITESNGPAVVISPEVKTESRWPRFGPMAAQRGVAAVISKALIPASEEPHISGALTIYSHVPHGLDGVNRNMLLLLATQASMAITATDAVTRTELEKAQLHRAIDSRDVIGQAKGIIMARRGVSAEEAFELLRQTSQELNIKLVELAKTLTARHTELDLEELP